MLLDLFNRVAAINIPFAVGAESNIRAVCLLKLPEFFGAFKFELAILNWALHSVNSERDNVQDHPAGMSDSPLQKHTQVRLGVHPLVIRAG